MEKWVNQLAFVHKVLYSKFLFEEARVARKFTHAYDSLPLTRVINNS